MMNWGIRSVLAAVTVVAVSFPALAGVSAFTGPGVVTRYEDYGSSLQVTTSAATINPAGCTTAALYFPKPGLTDIDKQNMSRDLLAAFMAGKNVRLKIDGTTCVTDGSSTYPVYYGVRIE